jgi:hypothetical protein
MSVWRLGGFILFCSLLAFGQQDAPATAPSSTSTTQTGSSTPAAPKIPPADLTPDANGALSQEQMRELTRMVLQNYRNNSKKKRDYTYIDREVVHKLDAKGRVQSTETKTSEVMELYGEQVWRLTEKDDKPLNAKEAAKEEERIQKLADRRKNESEDEKKKRQEEKEKARQKWLEFFSEVPDAYNFRLVGSEVLNGRDSWVIDGEPRTDFHARSKDAEDLAKLHGRLWIDKTEMQLAKMDIEIIDTVSFGWVLVRLHKGTRFVYEQTRVNDEVWLPQHYEAKVDARIALFKGDNEQDAGTYRDYKKFRTSSKILDMGEVKEQEQK